MYNSVIHTFVLLAATVKRMIILFPLDKAVKST